MIDNDVFDISGGIQKGVNLFHSFDKFNIHSNESAIFNDPDTQNTICRITGDNYSWINGQLKSSANAFYLLNPNGLMFGPGANIDIPGSFFISTGDFIELEDGQRVYADLSENSVLTVSQPHAFGFLDSDIAPVTFEGKGDISNASLSSSDVGLEVTSGKIISIVGGDISMTKGAVKETQMTIYDFLANKNEVTLPKKLGSLKAPEGDIHLASVASEGIAYISQDGYDLSSFTKFGNVTLDDHSLIDVSGNGAGNISIKGKNIILDKSDIYAENYGENNGGKIVLDGEDIILQGGSVISIDRHGNGSAADLEINAINDVIFNGDKSLPDTNGIWTRSFSEDADTGSNGAVIINSKNISLLNGSFIISDLWGGGLGENIELNATETISFDGLNSKGLASKITLRTFSKDNKAASCGNLEVKAKNFVCQNGAFFNSATYGKGNASSFIFNIKDKFFCGGYSIDPYVLLLNEELFGVKGLPHIQISPFVHPRSNGGNGGDIIINSGEMHIYAVAIAAMTYGLGNSGNLSINTKGRILMEGAVTLGIFCSAFTSVSYPRGVQGGNSGSIYINAGELTLKDGAYITSTTVAFASPKSGDAGEIVIDVDGDIICSGTNPFGSNGLAGSSGIYVRSAGYLDTAGDAGKIKITSNTLTVENGALITVNSVGYAKSGDIDIRTKEYINISGDSSNEPFRGYPMFSHYFISGIYASSLGPQIDTGDSGNILISTPKLMISDKGTISTSSNGGGSAGDITIDIDNLEMEKNAIISSSSKSSVFGGTAGTISINASDTVFLSQDSVLTTEAVNMRSNDQTLDYALSGQITLKANTLLNMLDSTIVTSVYGGQGNGGDIDIKDMKYITLNHSEIFANANEGKGGNIYIVSDHFMKSQNSIVSASSKLGIDGSIKIQSPNIDLSAGLTRLNAVYLDATSLVKTPCTMRGFGKVSRFTIVGRDGMPSSLMDLLPTNNEYQLKSKKKFKLVESLMDEYLNLSKDLDI